MLPALRGPTQLDHRGPTSRLRARGRAARPALSLALGANSALFDMFNSLPWAPLPVAAPERLVVLYSQRDRQSFYQRFSYPEYRDYRDQGRVFDGPSVTGIVATGFNLDFGSFEEDSVGTGAHGPDWHSAGVQMQFVAKAGGNKYRGSIYAGYENRHWQASNINGQQVARGAAGRGGLSPREANRVWSYHDVNGDVGGYVKPDTLSAPAMTGSGLPKNPPDSFFSLTDLRAAAASSSPSTPP